MVTRDDDYDQFMKDPRTECMFGLNCYQKNFMHLQKYKHPPKKRQAECTLQVASNKKHKKTEESPTTSDKATETPVTKPTVFINNVSIQDAKTFIKDKFLVDMPNDFYLFWEYCKMISKDNPSNAFATADLYLVGPYDVLAGKFFNVDKTPEEYLIHWRYYRDPPEIQTVLKAMNNSEYHIGYFRDDPNSLPVFLASNDSKNTGEFTCMGDNIFAAVWKYLDTYKKTCNPFKKVNINKLQTDLKKHGTHLNINLDTVTNSIKERNKNVLVRSFNSLGLVVPYDRETEEGYRHLTIGNAELRKLLDRVANASPNNRDKVMAIVQPVLTATNIATDECDFGTGIELGWDILAHGVDSLNSTIARLLSTNYELIHRRVFAKIIQAHMNNRKEGADLSIV